GSTVIGSGTVCSRVPFGPLTDTCWPSMFTSTPEGTVIGSFPMRDIALSPPLPDVGEDFAAHAVAHGLTVGLEAGRRRDDRDAEATENLRQVVGFRVHTQTRLRHAAEAGDAALTVRTELELHDEVLVLLAGLGAVVRDVTLTLEDLGDVLLDLRVPERHLVVVRRVRVPQTWQTVCARAGHRHGDLSTFLALVPRLSGACGEVGVIGAPSPARLAHAGQLPRVRHVPQADAAEAELAVHRVRPAAALATGVGTHLELRLPGGLGDECFLGHCSVLLEREAELAKQRTALVVGGGGGDDRDVHAARAVDGVGVDLVEHRLFRQAERVVAVPV